MQDKIAHRRLARVASLSIAGAGLGAAATPASTVSRPASRGAEGWGTFAHALQSTNSTEPKAQTLSQAFDWWSF